MAKNKSDTTIRTLIYILIFLIMVLLLLIVLIIPNIKSYKLNKSDLKIFSEKNSYLSRKQVELKKSIEYFKKENKNVIKTLDTNFQQDDFVKFASKHLKDVKIIKLDEKLDPSFEIYKFTAATSSKAPSDFFKFVDDLKNYKSLIKINFPISLVAKPDKIDLDFNIAVYKKQ